MRRLLSCSSRSLLKTRTSPEPSCQQQTPLKALVTLSLAVSCPMHPVLSIADQQQHSNPPNSVHPACEDPKDSHKVEKARHHLSHSLPTLHHALQSTKSYPYMIRARVRPRPSTRAFNEGLTNPTHESIVLTAKSFDPAPDVTQATLSRALHPSPPRQFRAQSALVEEARLLPTMVVRPRDSQDLCA